MDHDVTLESGVTVHNPMRVVPHGDGSEFVFTLFRRPEMTDPQFAADRTAVEKDLQTLKGLLEHQAPGDRTSVNKKTVAAYMDAFRASDHARVLACLTEDVEWEIPGTFHLRGKEAFDKEIENEAFVGRPDITVTRTTERDDVVVAEGSVRTRRKDGGILVLAFCDVFEMRDGKIRRLISYLMPVA
jgi:ketosteroid isomerase-like protein